MAEASRTKLLGTFKELLDSGAFSDLTITCGSDSYKVHKAVVCVRGDFFARAIKFGGKEAEDGHIDLPDDDPAVIKLLVQYLYEGEYDPFLPDDKVQSSVASITASNTVVATPSKKRTPRLEVEAIFPHTCRNHLTGFGNTCGVLCSHHACRQDCGYSCNNFTCQQCCPTIPQILPVQGPASQLLTHAKMYEIADKYDIVGLKDLVVEKFNRACQNFWNDPIFATAAHCAFSTTPDHDKGLRDIVSQTILNHMAELIKKPEVETLLTEFNGLAYGLLKMKTEAGCR